MAVGPKRRTASRARRPIDRIEAGVRAPGGTLPREAGVRAGQDAAAAGDRGFAGEEGPDGVARSTAQQGPGLGGAVRGGDGTRDVEVLAGRAGLGARGCGSVVAHQAVRVVGPVERRGLRGAQTLKKMRRR